MSKAPTVNKTVSNHERLKTGVILSLAFIFTGCLLRVYEYWTVSTKFVLPDNALALYGMAIFYDLLFLSFWSTIFCLIYFCFSFLHKTIAAWTVIVLIWLFLMIEVVLILYFAEVLTPLGADFFAYNMIEVSDTVRTSTEVSAVKILPFLLFPALFYVFFHFLGKIQWSEKIITGAGVLLLLLTIGYLTVYPSDDNFEKEIDYTLTTNKVSFFLGETIGEFITGSSLSAYSGPEFPLLHNQKYEDVLGSRMEVGQRPPNFVFIIIESFGGTLMPPHATYGGFTPFLDSLAANSLYWTHFLSTSGRSFNAHPSLFGSLPYGERGFMEMGYLAPDHHSLISILKNNGYHTAYYCGYDSRFDKLDQFLERQGIDLLMDASRFTEEYSKMDEIEGGFTWGYSDKDTYRRAFDFIDTFDHQTPRLDIFFTLNFHEPFIIQNEDYYREKFRERLSELDIDSAQKTEFEQYSEIFSALLYTDDAIRELIDRYRQREDFKDTIFIVTGDHRMIPVPHRNRIDRYYVPFFIYSPMLNESATFEGVSSHLDVTPSLLAFLDNNYSIEIPDSVHWLGEELNTSTDFTADRNIPFMRNKNQMPDYLSNRHFLSGDQMFELERGMRLQSINDPEIFLPVSEQFDQFKNLNRYVTSQNKILNITDSQMASREDLAEEEIYFRTQNLNQLNNEEIFFRARELAFTNQYEDARILLRRLLRESPNNHDARLLLGRTFGWDEDYDQAESHFDEILRRNPELTEAYVAKADLYFWMNDPEKTIEIINQGLNHESDSVDLLFRKARAHRQNGNEQQALEVLDEALDIAPNDERLQAFQQE